MKPSPAPEDALQMKTFVTWMGSDGICRTVVKADAEVDLECAIENSKAVNSFFTGKKFPLLIDTRLIRSITREARDHFSVNGRDTAISCMAFIVKSPVSRVIGNFFMSLNRPAVPAKLFDSETSALEWTRQFQIQ
jgi:hypothetical protein